MNKILLQLERLRRHYKAAVANYDEVSLLDLSHTLRIWVELKKPLVSLAPEFSQSIFFKTGLPAKKILHAARGHKFVFSYMPGGIKTYAAKGHLVSGPDMEEGAGNYSIGIAVRLLPEFMELGKFCVVGTSFDQSLVKVMSQETVSRCCYGPWLASEAVRLSFQRNGSGSLETVSISREMLVKRVANTLDGSHPSDAGGDIDNTFDAPVHHLLKYKIGGLPLPYFILLKIAQDILHVSPKIPGAPPG